MKIFLKKIKKNMKNQYGLGEGELEEVYNRYDTCVYCHKKMIKPYRKGNHKDSATIEHLNHLPPWDNIETVAFCCGSCNSSRSNKRIVDWFKTQYCLDKEINYNTVVNFVKNYIDKYEA